MASESAAQLQELPYPFDEHYWVGREVYDPEAPQGKRHGVVWFMRRLAVGRPNQPADDYGVPLEMEFEVRWEDDSISVLGREELVDVATPRFLVGPWLEDAVWALQKSGWTRLAEWKADPQGFDVAAAKEREAEARHSNRENARPDKRQGAKAGRAAAVPGDDGGSRKPESTKAAKPKKPAKKSDLGQMSKGFAAELAARKLAAKGVTATKSPAGKAPGHTAAPGAAPKSPASPLAKAAAKAARAATAAAKSGGEAPYRPSNAKVAQPKAGVVAAPGVKPRGAEASGAGPAAVEDAGSSRGAVGAGAAAKKAGEVLSPSRATKQQGCGRKRKSGGGTAAAEQPAQQQKRARKQEAPRAVSQLTGSMRGTGAGCAAGAGPSPNKSSRSGPAPPSSGRGRKSKVDISRQHAQAACLPHESVRLLAADLQFSTVKRKGKAKLEAALARFDRVMDEAGRIHRVYSRELIVPESLAFVGSGKNKDEHVYNWAFNEYGEDTEFDVTHIVAEREGWDEEGNTETQYLVKFERFELEPDCGSWLGEDALEDCEHVLHAWRSSGKAAAERAQKILLREARGKAAA